MIKFFEVVALLLCLVLVLSGCQYQIDNSKTKMVEDIEKDKEKCSCFVKTPNINRTRSRFIELNFHYNEKMITALLRCLR